MNQTTSIEIDEKDYRKIRHDISGCIFSIQTISSVFEKIDFRDFQEKEFNLLREIASGVVAQMKSVKERMNQEAKNG